MATSLTVGHLRDDGVARLTLIGELDADSAPLLTSTAASTIGAARVVIDASGLAFVDSEGLKAMVELRDSVVAAGGRLSIDRPSLSLGRLLEITAMADQFDLTQGDTRER